MRGRFITREKATKLPLITLKMLEVKQIGRGRPQRDVPSSYFYLGYLRLREAALNRRTSVFSFSISCCCSLIALSMVQRIGSLLICK
jgi:hypothetical protein